MSDRIDRAVRNNVGWYELMFRAHGIPCRCGSSLWRADATPPRYHSWGVTLTPGEAVMPEFQDLQAGAPTPRGIKDSFDCLDLRPHGLIPLFSAHWIHRPPGALAGALALRRIGDDDALAAWEAGWAHGDEQAAQHPRQFPPTLLDDPTVDFVSVFDGGSLVGGCILNATDDVVGLSNTYVLADDPVSVWRTFVAAAERLHAGRAVVGYERGADFEHARAVGFEPVGTLCVWT